MSFPHIKQPDSMECGATCLRMIAKFHGKEYSAETMQNLCVVTREGVSMLGIADAAEYIGFRTICGRMTLGKMVEQRPFPCILHWNQDHFVVLYDVKKKQDGKSVFYIADPGKNLLRIDEEEFRNAWISTRSRGEEKGILMALQPTPAFYKRKDERHTGRDPFHFLWGYMKPYKRFFIQLLLGLALGSVLQLIFPFLTQAIVDKGIATKNLNLIYLILAGQLMLVLSRASVDFIRRWILLHISARVNISLLSDFLIKLMRLPMSFFDTKMTGDLLQRIHDHERVERFLTAQTLTVLFSAFSFVVLFFLKKRRLLDYTYFEQRARNQSKTMQLLNGMQEIKLQHCERRRRWEWEDIQADLFRTNIESMRLQQSQEAGSILINEVKNIVITVIAATAVIGGSLSLGMMLAIQYIIGQLNAPVEQFVQFLYSWQDVKISLERMSGIHDREEEETPERMITGFNGSDRDIEIRNVTFQYEGIHSPKVLERINLKIPRGKITAIVGTSGSGKTTLIKLLLGYYNPVEGDIRVGGDDLRSFSLLWWRDQCGAVMQDGYLFSESIARNIAVDDGEIDKSRLLLAARIANIEEFIERLPLKYNTVIGPDGQGVSQGQRQRILIARAVYKNPSYLFFDEATNSLDANNERAIVENLTDFYRGKTVIIVAHRLSTVRNADQIVVLDRGRIVEVGSHEELIKRNGAYYNLVKNQLELGN
ncbi:peptidase domain-containing ABC transporter [Parabacteroides distasonis]|uniref:peptidase domain-containing ABC transporter n=1 Tax=Parabacteroides distasonis TaxID=823 RepID=UPI00189C48B2|nr:peptidase domain-containing ABC transporter [Parabacteroides distasonis]MDB9190401.1 peptidase domain-containing ABC transporter [Parabacteroides distasonis]MDB9199472.1 peptidase domain-containing ABC transporter [Parabacteroides distasonis]